mgnify:CR=1 FL=1
MPDNILIIDDDSKDGTMQLVNKMSLLFKNLKYLYKDKISYEQKNEIDDFYDIINSKNLINLF